MKIVGDERAARKTCGYGIHSIRALTERDVYGGGMLCPLWLVLLNASEIVSETLSGCAEKQTALAVVSYTVLAVPETNWKIRFGKQGYVFILSSGVVISFTLNAQMLKFLYGY